MSGPEERHYQFDSASKETFKLLDRENFNVDNSCKLIIEGELLKTQ